VAAKATDVRSAVISAVAEVTREPAGAIRDTHHLLNDLGVDSISAANLLVAIEERLSFRVPDGSEAQLVDVKSVGELVEVISTLFGSALDQDAKELEHEEVG
jgi:acyl carrier protein